MKKLLIKYSLMFVFVTVMSLLFLKLANDYGGYWINVSWAMGVFFGIEFILFMGLIKEYKKVQAL